MKKLFTLMLASVFACLSASAIETNDVVVDENQNPEVQVLDNANVPVMMTVTSFAQYGGDDYTSTQMIEPIQTHLNKRFAGQKVQNITREGHTYVVNLDNGTHVRYDNCGNPVCYGDHSHDCNHCGH